MIYKLIIRLQDNSYKYKDVTWSDLISNIIKLKSRCDVIEYWVRKSSATSVIPVKRISTKMLDTPNVLWILK